MSQDMDNHVTQSGRLHARPRRRSYWLAALLLLGALGIGCVIGVAGSMLYMKKKRFKPPPPEEWTDSMVGLLDKSVGLRPDERDEIRAMVLSRMETIRDNRRKMFETTREEMDMLRDDVDVILGPERTEKWNQEVERRWGRKRHGGPDDERGPRHHKRRH